MACLLLFSLLVGHVALCVSSSLAHGRRACLRFCR